MTYLWQLLIFCIIFLISLKFMPKFPMKLKMLVFIFGIGVISTIFLPFIIFRGRNYKNCLGPTWACRHFGKALGIIVEIRGTENIRPDHGSVVIVNHQSALDLIAIAHLWPILGNITTVAKKELLYLPFFGLGLWASGFIFIDRQHHNACIESLNKQSRAINERKCKLLVFPEGTRNSKKNLLPFKKGSFHIAIQNQCPIQPIIISYYDFLHNPKSTNQNCIVEIMPEILTKTFHKDNLEELVNYCQDTMQIRYDQINEEIQTRNF